jgi:hypothetical protein
MKDYFYFILGCVLAAPAACLLFSGEFIYEIIFIAYVAILKVFVPKNIWRKIFRAHVRASKLLEK